MQPSWRRTLPGLRIAATRSHHASAARPRTRDPRRAPGRARRESLAQNLGNLGADVRGKPGARDDARERREEEPVERRDRACIPLGARARQVEIGHVHPSSVGALVAPAPGEICGEGRVRELEIRPSLARLANRRDGTRREVGIRSARGHSLNDNRARALSRRPEAAHLPFVETIGSDAALQGNSEGAPVACTLVRACKGLSGCLMN